jgi:hypothetical protein
MLRLNQLRHRGFGNDCIDCGGIGSDRAGAGNVAKGAQASLQREDTDRQFCADLPVNTISSAARLDANTAGEKPLAMRIIAPASLQPIR